MAHIINKQFLLDGPKNAILQVYLESDGVQSELSNFVLIDPTVDFADSATSAPNTIKLAVRQVWYNLSWFDALLSFENTPANIPSWVLPRDSANYADFRYFGGLKDMSNLDGTGRLLLSTSGFQPAGMIGSLVIEVAKVHMRRGQQQPQ